MTDNQAVSVVGSGQVQLHVQQAIRGGIDSGVQPVVLAVDPNTVTVDEMVIRIHTVRGL